MEPGSYVSDRASVLSDDSTHGRQFGGRGHKLLNTIFSSRERNEYQVGQRGKDAMETRGDHRVARRRFYRAER